METRDDRNSGYGDALSGSLGSDCLGTRRWEGGTRVAYVYRRVAGVHPQTAATFARYGTRQHSLAMQTDALANLGRYLDGEADEERRAEVEAVVQAGIAGLN